jgi:hypothetical protein
MGHTHHDSGPEPDRSARARGIALDAEQLPEAGARWQRIAVATPTRRAHPARPATPIVLRVSSSHGTRSWAIDPGLVVVLAAALALAGLGALDSLLFALLMRLL